MCHCNYTYGDWFFTQVCSAATPMHCSTGQVKIASPLFNAALQIRLTACSVSLQLHLRRFALQTGVQRCNTNALQHWSGQNSFPTVLWCECSGTRLLSAGLAQQHRAPRNAFCNKQCCIALACSVSLQKHPWRYALNTGVQCCNTNALQHWSGQNAFPTAQCCSVNQAHSMLW